MPTPAPAARDTSPSAADTVVGPEELNPDSLAAQGHDLTTPRGRQRARAASRERFKADMTEVTDLRKARERLRKDWLETKRELIGKKSKNGAERAARAQIEEEKTAAQDKYDYEISGMTWRDHVMNIVLIIPNLILGLIPFAKLRVGPIARAGFEKDRTLQRLEDEEYRRSWGGNSRFKKRVKTIRNEARQQLEDKRDEYRDSRDNLTEDISDKTDAARTRRDDAKDEIKAAEEAQRPNGQRPQPAANHNAG